jgi:hypothetical protein
MWLFNQLSSSARTAVIYITVGALCVIWTGVWFLYLHNNPPDNNAVYYWCGGFLVTGITLIGIGFGLGQIGRSARHADVPPQEVKTAQPTAGAVAPVVLDPNSTAAAPVAQVVVPASPINRIARV